VYTTNHLSIIDLLQKSTSQAIVKTSLFGRSKLDQMLLELTSLANQQHAKACEGKLRQSRKAKHAGQFRVVPQYILPKKHQQTHHVSNEKHHTGHPAAGPARPRHLCMTSTCCFVQGCMSPALDEWWMLLLLKQVLNHWYLIGYTYDI
jgi:hypothetical protein